jgi:general secretion pathway protein F
MPSFEFTALRAGGERLRGEITGPSEQAVLAELESRKLTPLAILPKKPTRTRRSGISSRALGGGYQQLADLLKSGVPLLRALKLLGNRKTKPRLSRVFAELSEGVEQGDELAQAMSRRPEVFNRVHIAMIRAGEKGGFLEQVLERLGQLLLSQAELRSKVLGNLIYPGVLVTFGSLLLFIIFRFFVPMVSGLFAQIPGGLPAPTRLVLGISKVVGEYGLITLTILTVGFVTLWRVSKTPRARLALARFRGKLPIVGPLERAIATSRFCRLLGTLLSNGVPMLSSLEIARDASGNALLEAAVTKSMDAVRAGEPLAKPLGESGQFPDDVVEIIAVAEAANNLDDVLVQVAETTDTRVDRMLGVAVRLVEPILLLSIAGVVGLVAVALILPMMKLSSAAT